MVILKLAFIIFLITFVISAIFGLIGFLIDIIRNPQPHEKVKIIPSAETSDLEELKEAEDGLILDESIGIFGGAKNESNN